MSLSAVLTVAGARAANAQVKVGDVRPYGSESPHPYPAGSGGEVVWHEMVQSPGAAFIRVHFEDLDLALGDVLTVSSLDGSRVWTARGRSRRGSGDAWSFAFDGDTVIVRIHAARGAGFGYRITEVVHGTVPLGARVERQPESVCGTDGREHVACYEEDPQVEPTQRPVARLLYNSGGGAFFCTGALVRGALDSLLMTNYHCLASPAEVDTLVATLGHQASECNGSGLAEGLMYAGDELVTTSASLDYSLITLHGNPEGLWGELTPTAVDAPAGSPFWLVQHAGGGPKLIGYWEDAARTMRCTAATTSQTIEDFAPGSQMEYACDTAEGASGSPLVSAATGRVVGLHHLGGVPPGSCTLLNAATMMRFICEDAGSLLACHEAEPEPEHRRYFAEGAEGFFETFIGVFNPDPAQDAMVSVDALAEQGTTGRSSFSLGPRENAIVWLRDLIGEGSAASIVSSNLPVVADRYMRWGSPAYGSTMERSLAEPSTRWHFGEGATGPFHLFYLLENIGSEDAAVTVTYLREHGGPVQRTYTVAPFSRYTVYVNAEPGLQSANVSAVMDATVPIVAERSMYLNSGGLVFRSGTAGSGATSLSPTWYFAEGATGFFDEFVLLGNPASDAIQVTAEFLLPDGSVIERTYPVAGQARRTVWVNAVDPRLASTAVGVRLSAPAAFMAERAMWWPHGAVWQEGHVSLGTTETGTVWAVAYAGQNCGEDSYVLVANASSAAGRVRVTTYGAASAPIAREFELAGNARLTVSAAQHLGVGCGPEYSVLVESIGSAPVPIVVEASRYSLGGAPLESGAAALATKVQ